MGILQQLSPTVPAHVIVESFSAMQSDQRQIAVGKPTMSRIRTALFVLWVILILPWMVIAPLSAMMDDCDLSSVCSHRGSSEKENPCGFVPAAPALCGVGYLGLDRKIETTRQKNFLIRIER